jgi:hypothetical protein
MTITDTAIRARLLEIANQLLELACRDAAETENAAHC